MPHAKHDVNYKKNYKVVTRLHFQFIQSPCDHVIRCHSTQHEITGADVI